MPEIRDVTAIADKWMARAPQAAPDYEAGVRDTKKDWAKNTTAANEAFKAGVTAALAANRWTKGVEAAGTQKWRDNTLAKGPLRWAQGIQLSGDAFARGFAKFAEVIRRTTLPPRGPRGSAGNYRRSQIMGEALHAARVGS